MKTLRFLSWLAVSSSPQAEKESLDDQERLNREFVSNLPSHYSGYAGTIVKTLKLIGTRSIIELSAARQRHRQYEELVVLIKGRAIDALICRSRDRIARSDALILTIERLCNEHDIIVVPRQSLPATLDIRAIRSSEGAGLVPVIEGYYAASTVLRLVHDNKMGMAARVKALRLFPNRVPWGYEYVFSEKGDQSIHVDPGAALVLRSLLLDLFAEQRLNYQQIAQRLNLAGQPSPSGRAWSTNSVSEIVRNACRYAGYLTLNRRSGTGRELIHVLGEHAPIISEVELARVQVEKDARRFGRLPRGGVFSGIVVCTASGHPLSAHTQNYKTRDGAVIYYRRMRCLHCNPSHSLPENTLMNCVSVFLNELQESGGSDASLTVRAPENKESIERTIASLLTRVGEVEDKKRKLLSLFLQREDISPEMFDEEMDALTRQAGTALAAIDAQRQRLTSAVQVEQEIARIIHLRQMAGEIIRLLTADPLAAQQFLFQSLRINVSPTGENTVIDNICII